MIQTLAPVVLFVFFYQDVATAEMRLSKARKLSGKRCFKYVVSIFLTNFKANGLQNNCGKFG